MPPVRALRDHLMWTRSGIVWATWRLTGLRYGYASAEAKHIARAQHQALFQGLRGEALLLGIRAPERVDRTTARVRGDAVKADREWLREVDLLRDALERRASEERSYWLSVPLATTGIRPRMRAFATVVEAELRSALALPKRMPTVSDVDEALRAADRIQAGIPEAFEATPATAAELCWLGERAMRRGLVDGALDVRPTWSPPTGSFSTPTTIGDALIDEGASTDRASVPFARNPFAHRFVKIHGSGSDAPSYQVLLALTSAPKGGWVVPGVEWLATIDRLDAATDWGIRLDISSGTDVRRKNQSAELSLRDQVAQQDADADALMIGNGARLGDVASTLRDYAAALGRSEDEVEVQATTILAVGAPTADEAVRRAEAVRHRFRPAEFRFDPPLGGQQQLWWAMQPGVVTSSLTRELAQLTTGREFASAMPLVSSDLGDDTGLQLGVNLTTGRHSPVLLDPAATIQADRSASIGVVAELGAGKSYALKRIAGDCIDRGARLFIIDRTESREYATFAASLLPGRTAVIDLADPASSLDPLRLFGPQAGARHVQSLFSSLLGVRPRDELGVELARLLEPTSARDRGLRSLADLRAELARGAGGQAGRRILGLIDLIAGSDFGRVLFDGDLPPLDLRVRAIIPLTAGLALPTAQELDRQHLFDELPLEKIYGRAMYALLTGIARQIAFTSRELAVFCADECHHITTSPEGQGYVLDFLRDGRKHNALAMLASHDPHDFGDVRARGLIPVRMVMRHTDPLLAERALEWLERGLERDPALVRELTEDTSPAGPDGTVVPERRGEALFRDARQRIGKIRITPSLRPERRAALGSTPRRGSTPAVGSMPSARSSAHAMSDALHPHSAELEDVLR